MLRKSKVLSPKALALQDLKPLQHRLRFAAA